MEMGFWNAVVSAQMPLSLVPEILDPVDMVPFLDKFLGMIDPVMPELADIENIVGAEAISIDDAVGFDALTNNPEQCLRLGVRDRNRVDQPTALEQAKDRNLACDAASSLALPAASEIALVDFNLTIEKRRLFGKLRGNEFAKLMVIQDGCIAINPCQFGCCPGRNSRYKEL